MAFNKPFMAKLFAGWRIKSWYLSKVTDSDSTEEQSSDDQGVENDDSDESGVDDNTEEDQSEVETPDDDDTGSGSEDQDDDTETEDGNSDSDQSSDEDGDTESEDGNNDSDSSTDDDDDPEDPEYEEEENINDGLPESSSTFSTEYASEAAATAVAALSASIADEDAEDLVFTETELSVASDNENIEYGEFLGVYDVTGEAGVQTLVSPTQIDDEYVEGAVVMHYDEESDSWEQVTTDVEIKDGYVWATLDSFSPIAVYTVRRKMFTVTLDDSYIYLFCQGLPATITKVSSTKTRVTDCYGRTVDLTPVTNKIVCGGYYNRTDYIDEINLTYEDGKLHGVVYGSINNTDTVAEIGTINFSKAAGTITSFTTAGIGRVKIGTVNAENVYTTSAPSAGAMSYRANVVDPDVNGADPDPETCACYVENANLTLTSGTIGSTTYVGGSNGYSYTKNAKVILDAGTVTALYANSNGTVDNFEVIVNGGTIKTFGSGNRGKVNKATITMNGGTITNMYLGTGVDDDETGVVGSVELTVKDGATIGTLNAGRSNATDITAADEIIKSIYVASGASVTYADGFEEEFASVITA